MFGNRSQPESHRVEKELTILNPGGLHPGPARGFVLRVVQHKSRVWLRIGDELYRGERVMDLLAAYLREGSRFTLIVEGPDASTVATLLESYLKELVEIEESPPLLRAGAFDF